MKKFTIPEGYIAYSCYAFETGFLGGMGICDDCGEFAPCGYLVPVLNHYMCPKCFQEWTSHNTFYLEDLPIEAETQPIMNRGSRWKESCCHEEVHL